MKAIKDPKNSHRQAQAKPAKSTIARSELTTTLQS